MRILALDIATNCGFALWDEGKISAGNWVLETDRGLRYQKKLRMDRRCDARIMALINQLSAIGPVDWYFFEDIRFGTSTAMSQLWGSLRGALWAFSHIKGTQIDCLDTGKLKKYATGSGAADKAEMARAFVCNHPGEYTIDEKGLVFCQKTGILYDDNAIDALHLLDFALSILK